MGKNPMKEKKGTLSLSLSLSLSLFLQKKLLTPFSTQFPNTLLPCTTITTTNYHSCNSVPNKKKPSILFANFKDPKLTISFLLALPTTTKARILCSDSL
jgi:hypothetical protein